MRILTYTQIGTQHSNHNEDAFAKVELTDHHHLIAVINGTAAGKKGYFTAALVAQVLEKVGNEMALRLFAEKESAGAAELLRACTEELFRELAKLRSRLNLKKQDLRLTMTLGVTDLEDRTAEVVVIGSGIVSCDGETIELSQYTEPDYLVNHLDKKDFGTWWTSHDKRIRCENCLDLAIATPGILTFEPFSHDSYQPVTDDEILTFLLSERNDGPVEHMFRRKVIYIEDKFGLLATDDVTIVRVFFV
ncbi:protein phosphatase 2C domain-containing protein [Neolewinella antarctica]|uniref:Uncharacterized protein n=1 Tax=Neolewinella antarctica TaxID=442734 RepID=A0ABX0X8E5_9BACT|nr:protein phosphatase 2C domain-containing protein [Neolewinella antarctica]NJC25510.1 hypothetical protein [Neolewinella antarctica]